MARLSTRVIAAIGASLVVAAVVVGYAYVRSADPARAGTGAAHDVWTCPMHPELREHGPGKCPKCGMDLVKESSLTAHADAAAAGQPADTLRAPVQLDTRRRQMLGVRTVRVASGAIERQIRAVGIVRYDETRLADVNLKLDGWVSKLHADSTGLFIRRGQPLVDLYSPDLLATENEYLLALSTRDALRDSEVPDARTQADRLVESARQRLLLWDLPAAELQRLEHTRKADATVTFRSPVEGFVIEKPVVEGMRASAGQTLFKVADLSRVWVEADIFESDAPFIRVGARASVTVDALPGQPLSGRAVYIYPFVEEKTRTLKVRFEFPNPGQRLKPGMYANIEFVSTAGQGLTIPADALLDTGREQIVFVAEGDGYFNPRPVKAGTRVGDRVQIVSGLSADDVVASGAAFFLDSESQLRAAAGGWEPQVGGGETAPAGAASSLTVSFRTAPDPPRSGENTFEVDLKDASGHPIEDAQVRVVLFMPAMPSMNMPAMSSEARLSHAGGGTYRGNGMVTMSGRWDVTITATRNGARLGSRQTTVVAR
jgi:RND family efflux transporter MFP subunit